MVAPQQLLRQVKTRQDNALFGVLYSPMYIDFYSHSGLSHQIP